MRQHFYVITQSLDLSQSPVPVFEANPCRSKEPEELEAAKAPAQDQMTGHVPAEPWLHGHLHRWVTFPWNQVLFIHDFLYSITSIFFWLFIYTAQVVNGPPCSLSSQNVTPREKQDVKRTVPVSEEKISPVKKALKAGDEGTEEMTDAVPTPSPAQLDPTGQAEVLRSLNLALDRISQLEAQLKEKDKSKPASAAGTPLSPGVSMLTPLSKAHRSSPGTTSSTAPSGDAGEDSAPGSEKEEGEETANENGKTGEVIEFPNGAGFMSHDALRMRLRRLCEEKAKTKKCHVDVKTREQYVRGGEDREWLEIALVEALQKVGPDRCHRKKLTVFWQTGNAHHLPKDNPMILLKHLLPMGNYRTKSCVANNGSQHSFPPSQPVMFTWEPKAEFKARVILVRERMEMKEHEVTGQWLTEEKMVKSGDYTA